MLTVPLNDPEYSALLTLSAKVGSESALVQGAGGNTSIKHDGLMWIKASGTWLMHASEKDIMVPVEIAPLLEAMNNHDPAADKAIIFVPDHLNPAALRPSIETTVHLVLPQRIVVHVHCVETIAIAIREDSEAVLAHRLQGFNWVSVPYVKPGLTLSRTLQQALRPDTDVIILGNHGLVVAAATVADAQALLLKTCAALRVQARPEPPVDTSILQNLVQNTDYQLPLYAQSHAAACDSVSLTIAAGGSLYPDHVIFLGAGSVVAKTGESITDVVARVTDTGASEPISILYPGLGTVMHRESNAGQEAMARCLSDVCARVPADAPVHYLSDTDNAELLNWDAEKYRQALNQT